MRVMLEDAGPCRKAILVEAPAEDVRDEYGRVVLQFARQCDVPGFRRGRAPLPVVERQFFRQIISETRERLLPRLYRKAVEQQNLRPVAVVDVSELHLDPQRGMRFRVTVDVPPEFTLPKYRKIPLPNRPVAITDDQVQQALDELLDRHARYEDVTGRTVQSGDLVQIDYEGQCGGEKISRHVPSIPGLSEGRDVWVLMGEPEFLPGLSRSVVGVAVGDEKTVPVAFPPDFHVVALAGKHCTYTIRVKAIRQKVRPVLGPDLLKEWGVESEPALRQKVRRALEAAAEVRERARRREAIATYLLKNTAFDLPQTVVEQETQQTIHQIVRRAVLQGETQKHIIEQRDEIVNLAARSSAERIKLRYILAKIAEHEKIQVTEEDVQAEFQNMASRYGISVERLRAEFRKRHAEEKLRSDLCAAKTLDFLLEHAHIKR